MGWRTRKGLGNEAQADYAKYCGQETQEEDSPQTNLIPTAHLQFSNTRERQRQNCDVANDLCDGKPQGCPDLGWAGMTMVRVGSTDEDFCEEKGDAPSCDEDHENIVGDTKNTLLVEDSTVEEQYAQLDGAVRDFLNDESCIVDLPEIRQLNSQQWKHMKALTIDSWLTRHSSISS